MKVIQVVAYYPPHVGGMQNCVKEISERLAKKGNNVEVFTSDIGCKKGRPSSISNLKINYLKSWEFAHTAIIPSLFFKLLKISKDSIMHIHVAQAYVPEIVYLVSKIKNIPYIAHIHADVEPAGKMGLLLPFYKKIFLQKILNSASKIVVPTNDYIAIISKMYTISKHKIIVIPHGVDLNNFKNISVALHNPIRLLFVGRLTKQKDIPLLIKSFKNFVDNHNFNVELNIAGEGEDRHKIVQLIKTLNLEGKVNLLGVIRGNRLYEIYSNSDIFILTSIYESFGIVLIEAMASGLPIIASNILGVKNVIKSGKTGLLVNLTPKRFAEAIGKLIDNQKLRKKIIINGLKEVKKYNWDKIVPVYERIYQKIKIGQPKLTLEHSKLL